MVGLHHQLSGHELGQTPGDSEGQEGLECCSPWGCKESDTTERLNNNNPVTPSIDCEGEINAVTDMQCSMTVYSSASVHLDQRGCQHRHKVMHKN